MRFIETRSLRFREITSRQNKDRQLAAFGASSHPYTLSPPISEEAVEDFEQIYQVTLPAEYKYFITRVGTGGYGPSGGAGPAHGLY
jgi:hypothetical protein